MFRFFGTPNLAVVKMSRVVGNRLRPMAILTFDKDGQALVDEKRIDTSALASLKMYYKFEVVEEIKAVEEVVEVIKPIEVEPEKPEEISDRIQELMAMDIEELKLIAKEKKVRGYQIIKSKETLIKKIVGEENVS